MSSARTLSTARLAGTVALVWIAVQSATLLAGDSAAGTSPAPAATLLFERDVRPILAAHCWKCHGLEAREAGLDLRDVSFMLKGGENGPAIVKGDSKKSALYERISARTMPPKGELALTASQIETVRRWLDDGAAANESSQPAAAAQASPVTAENRNFWAFRRPERPGIPAVRDSGSVRTPVDAFVLSKLEANGLSFSHDADRHTLARRLFLDLVGLPPSPRDVEDFANDRRSDACARLVDRLLNSPGFGERWGRHWLDTVGYADTIGDDTDAAITKLAAGKWRYRDYVIRAFNLDMPYDRFLVEQFAGDELFDWRTADSFTPEQESLLVATGFLRMAPDETLQNELNTADIRHAVLQNTMETALGGVLGLTVKCARCHSHKFDPIPQADYYRLLSVFTPAFNPQKWLQPAARELPDVPPAQKQRIQQHNADLDTKIAARKAQLDAIRKPHASRLRAEKLAALPDNIREETRLALDTPAEKRTENQKSLLKKHAAVLHVSTGALRAAMNDHDRNEDIRLDREIAGINSQRQSWQTIQAVYDVDQPPPTYLLRRGNHETPGPEVDPALLQVLCDSESAASLRPDKPYEKASGRRLALARRLTDPSSPAGGLVARVFVNRVWQQLFGEGIVATSDNFGASGSRPTHPELLDWLTVAFMDNGWRIKPLVKLLVMSRVYRQASEYGPASPAGESASVAERVDPDDALLWRMRLRPLEAEAVRDSILAVSGNLDSTPNGPPVLHGPDSNGMVTILKDKLATPTSQWRRSVYLLCRRRYHLSLLETFDQPEVSGACLRRREAPVVGQALTMLNDAFLTEQSRAFAQRLRRETAADSLENRIGRAFEIALGRGAGQNEVRWSQELLARQERHYRNGSATEDQAAQEALVHLCSMLLNSSEFLYIR